MVSSATAIADRGGASPVTPEREGRERFKALIRKIGSGEHTSKGLSREEAAEAMELMLTAAASPAQIGAFLIAHRIRRPEPQELAGMLDTYRRFGPVLTGPTAEDQATGWAGPPICFGMPFDGRSRTAAIYPLTTLVLLSAGRPVVLQGAGRMPVKYGVTAAELFAALGLELTGLPLERVQEGFNRNGLALLHQPDHFPLAEELIPYREDLGKRPPVASLELLWSAHQGPHLLVSGFVHPPTEARAWQALALAGERDLVTVKGLEGSTDLPTSRACVTATVRDGRSERRILHPRDHGCFAPEPGWTDAETWTAMAQAALQGEGPLALPLLWNAACYLAFSNPLQPLEQALEQARALIGGGAPLATLGALRSWRQSLVES
ncbi:anthranilate phosphoribosyltransferase [Synechococcus sp. RSCCF101]|uniref:anthranilate phosphoribosyltransferase family protein n=1 Tax=Synechococcus sp. RSCCF101 TaxID=2511069 RepID=UPI0012452593|nr:anthranilate phosphoribosyltransferase family protein [Synechococcus sp. RSCCF101]QEY32619.1 anthranilate phosphoribosyltransferase [Synechococcus sp. RSCCF101]